MSRIKRTNKTIFQHKPDKTILYFALIMTIFGAIMIFDASVYKATETFSDPFYFLKHQVVWILVGSIPAFVMYFWDYKKFLKLSTPALIFSILLLIAVLLVGDVRNGARRWLTVGPIDIQPAEFAKIAIITYLAAWLPKKEQISKNLKQQIQDPFVRKLLGFIFIIGLISILIIMEPDLGTTIILCITSFSMFLIAQEEKTHTLRSLALLLLAVPIAILAAVLEPYRLRRVQTFLTLLLKGEVADPRGSGYQIQQILIGIGSGGLLGKGFGQSRQRFGYLVENTAFTDSIFAIVLEELGLIGGTVIIIAWLLFLWRGIKISINAPDKEGKLLASGISIWLTLQALINIAANIGLLPLTGLPSPFLTYGGSNTIVTLIGIAILLNISKYTNNNE